MAGQLKDSNGALILGAIMSSASIGTSGVVSVGNTSGATAVINADKDVLVRLAVSQGHCHFVIGTTPTATITASPMLVNNWVDFVQVKAGEKLAFIKDSGVTSSTVAWTVID
jgi:hypothetical protein